MRKGNIFSVVFSLFLLVPASIIWAQTISSQKGLTTIEFNVPQGNIKVYLPVDIRPKDVITGTVVAEPEGRNEKQKEKNLAELKNYAITINKNRFLLDQARSIVKLVIPTGETLQGLVELRYGNNPNPVQQLTIPPFEPITQKPASIKCVMPTHALTDAPMNVQGPFDGDLANTNCTVGSQQANVLAESPRNSFINFPANGGGPQPTQITENGKPLCNTNVNGVQMSVSAGKLNLQRGESTSIEVNITGLQNLNDPAILSLTNITTGVVNMLPSNMISIPLMPDSVSSGNFNRRFDIKSIRAGGFSVNVNLDFGDVMLSPLPGDDPPNKQAQNQPANQLANQVIKQGPKCKCIVKASIHLMKKENDIYSYMAMPLADCQGENCAYQKDIKFNWKISSGIENAEIIETSESGFEIKVRQKKTGSFTIKHSATVICSDGTSCTDEISYNEKGDGAPVAGAGDKPGQPPVPFVKDPPKIPTVDTSDKKPKECLRTIAKDKAPAMNGGLKREILSAKTIARDGFVALIAEAADFDILKIVCTPLNPLCVGGPAEMIVPVSGKVNFAWEIIEGEGQFVQMGCLYGKNEIPKKDSGEHVIFMPPFVPLPDPSLKVTVTSKVTKIRLLILDGKDDGMEDDTVKRIFEIITKRFKEKPDEYKIEFKYPYTVLADKLPVKTEKKPGGPCIPQTGLWEKDEVYGVPKIILPDIPDNNRAVLGQWIRLKVEDMHEKDLLKEIECVSTGGCSVQPATEEKFEDNIIYEWNASIKSGRFIGSKFGRYVIFQLPQEFEKDSNGQPFEVTFTVTASNLNGVQADDGQSSSSPPFIITVYQPGVKLLPADKNWLPTNDENSPAKFTSSLMIKVGEDWKPAPAHTCRIHYFDLFDVSNERGVCLNSPLPAKANSCRDLKIKNENEHEAFDNFSQAGCPDKSSYFVQARTQKPEHSYAINIYSEDYGSWGFLRSFANVNEEIKGENKTNPWEKKPGMTSQNLEEIEKGLSNYNANLTAYYAKKREQIMKQLPYYESIPITSSDFKHPFETEDDKKEKRGIYKYPDNRISIPIDLDSNHIPDNGWIISGTNGPLRWLDYTKDINNDSDNEPIGDEWKGDGLSIYEEYRGFMVSKPSLEHHRTNPNKKDLFISNQNGLPIDEFERITKITVHQISVSQYSKIVAAEKKTIKDWGFSNQRFINFNYGLAHETHQKGLYLINTSLEGDFLGLTPPETDEPGDNETPAPPNWNKAVQIDVRKIRRLYDTRYRETPKSIVKLKQIVAHELCHALNVSHHGERGSVPGLDSGNPNCIMRYETILETPGNILCLETGSANEKRGSCALQIRVSGRKDPGIIMKGYPIRKE